MEEIIRNLSNPAWWFTAVIVAVIASLMAGLLRDWIPKWFSKISKGARLRSYRSRKNIVFNRSLYLLSPQLHSSALYRAKRDFILALIFTFFALLQAPINLFYKNYPDYDPLHKYSPEISSFTVGLMTLSMLVMAAPIYFRLVRQLTILSATHQKLRIEAVRSYLSERANKKRQSDA